MFFRTPEHIERVKQIMEEVVNSAICGACLEVIYECKYGEDRTDYEERLIDILTDNGKNELSGQGDLLALKLVHGTDYARLRELTGI